MKIIRKVLASIKRADTNYSLINNNDRIAVGISGGKDSMALFHCLNLYKLYSEEKFEIVPVLIDLGFKGFDYKIIEEYITKLGYKLNVIDSKNVATILELNQKKDKHLPCSICSRMKKAIINKAAKDLNCNKVAFAHHMDDALETLFLNIFYSGKIATFEPKMFLSNAKITFIRPLILVKEEEIINLINENDIPYVSSHCPADKNTTRENIKNLIKDLSKNKFIKANLYKSLINEDYIKLFKKEIKTS